MGKTKILEKCKTFANFALDKLFPDNLTCDICGQDFFENNDGCVCNSCLQTLPFIKEKVCKKCGLPIFDEAEYCDFCISEPKLFKVAHSVFEYKDKIRNLIIAYKFNSAKYLCNHFCYFLEKLYKEKGLECDILVGVPMTENKIKQRGYNQADLLAENLGLRLGIKFGYGVVKKTKETINQKELNFNDRQKSLSCVFAVKRKMDILDKNVLIVDDVYTTGATVNELSKTLLKSGAKNVYVLTLAHTIFNSVKK